MEHECRAELYDVIRIIATLLVVIGHSWYTMWSGDSGFIELNLDHASNTFRLALNEMNYIGGWIYSFHMPLFFMLSGGLYKYSRMKATFNDLLKNKFCRLILPYYFTGIIYMFPIKRLSGFYTKECFMSAFVGFFLGRNCGHLWFLIVLFWCFVIFYSIEKYIICKDKATPRGGCYC